MTRRRVQNSLSVFPRVLVADPPWKFSDKLPGKSRGAEKNYSVMTTDAICSFQLPEHAIDSYLFMWRVASMQQEALDVVKAWGFTLKTELVWKKLTITGKRHFGMGHYFRAEHETCLVAVRGKPREHSHSLRTTFEARVGRHSEKPGEFYRLVEKFTAGPYVELFARRYRSGWECYGNELSRDRAVGYDE